MHALWNYDVPISKPDSIMFYLLLIFNIYATLLVLIVFCTNEAQRQPQPQIIYIDKYVGSEKTSKSKKDKKKPKNKKESKPKKQEKEKNKKKEEKIRKPKAIEAVEAPKEESHDHRKQEKENADPKSKNKSLRSTKTAKTIPEITGLLKQTEILPSEKVLMPKESVKDLAKTIPNKDVPKTTTALLKEEPVVQAGLPKTQSAAPETTKVKNTDDHVYQTMKVADTKKTLQQGPELKDPKNKVVNAQDPDYQTMVNLSNRVLDYGSASAGQPKITKNGKMADANDEDYQTLYNIKDL